MWVLANEPANPRAHEGHTPTRVAWKKPSIGVIKCNLDAAFDTQSGTTGIGVCLRDDRGQILLGKL